ncbi:MAG: hypothetical protein JXB26_00750 [Candidatus Aminicenantes bacterium]|nr:hypothetical protein [Candidatus Aminicenantes bacterium]
MKSLATKYSQDFRSNLSYFPVWQPGDPIYPGEIGYIEKGVFYSEGQITHLFSDLNFTVKKKAGTSSMSFHSDSGISVDGGVSGSFPLKAEGGVRVSFSRKGGSIFHAVNISLQYIKNLNTVAGTISKWYQKWPKGMVFVTHAEVAERYAVLISKSGGWEVDLKGDISALKALQIAHGSVALSSVKGAGYNRTGTGPVALRIYGFKSRDRKPHLLYSEKKVTKGSPFSEISPFDPGLDISIGK